MKPLDMLIAMLIFFAAIARGGHDLWAATLISLLILILMLYLLANVTFFQKTGIRLPLWMPMCVFVAFFLVSFVTSLNPHDSFLTLINLFCAVLLFILSSNIFKSEKNVARFLAVIVPCLWIEFLFASIQLTFLPYRESWRQMGETHPFLDYFLLNANEQCGSLMNANLLAVFVLPFIFPLAWKAVSEWKESKKSALFWFSGVIAALGCIVITKSGAGFISLLFGLLLLVAERKVSRKFVGAACLVFLVVLAAVILYKYTHTYNKVLEPLRNPNNRFFWWASSFRMFLDYPWFGIGPGGFPSAYLTYKVGGTENTLYAHNALLTILAENGVFVVCTGIVWCTGFAGLAFRAQSQAFIRLGFLPAILSIVCFYSFNFGVEYLGNQMILAVFCGIVVGSLMLKAHQVRISTFVVCLLGAVAGIPYLASPFFASRFLVDGNIYLEEKNLELAQKSYESALALDNRSWEPYFGLAQIAVAKGDIGAAVKFSQKALERNKLNPHLKRMVTDLKQNSPAGL